MPKYDALKKTDLIPFGQYKDTLTIQQLLDRNPKYLVWCGEQLSTQFDSSVIKELEQKGFKINYPTSLKKPEQPSAIFEPPPSNFINAPTHSHSATINCPNCDCLLNILVIPAESN